jgi:hypothetical protein
MNCPSETIFRFLLPSSDNQRLSKQHSNYNCQILQPALQQVLFLMRWKKAPFPFSTYCSIFLVCSEHLGDVICKHQLSQGDFMEQPTKPDCLKLIFVPALITLVITLLRLGAEFMDFPAWLASKSAGAPGALLGISWLPPFLGIYFAYKLAGAPGKLWWNLLKTLVLYGLAARIPVIIIMGLAIYGSWGTHYDAFPGSLAQATLMRKFLLGGVATQLIWWVIIWTVGFGMLTGLITAFVRSRRPAKD